MSAAAAFPEVTAVVVCRNEAGAIGPCLTSLRAQQTPFAFEILVVDGGSSDDTRTVVRRHMAEDGRIRLLDNPRGRIGFARNIGWRSARTPLVAYTDADCRPDPGWLACLWEAYQTHKSRHPQLAAVGGASRPPAAAPFFRALDIFSRSYFGNRGSAQWKPASRRAWVNHLPTLNVLYERNALAAAGGFDETVFANMGEDCDLNHRLGLSGRSLLWVPRCRVIHWQTAGFIPWAGRMYRYGRGRALLMKRHPGLRSPVDLAVLLLPLALLSALLGPAVPSALAPLGLYSAFFALHSLQLCLGGRRPGLWPRVAGLFFTTHLFYAMGMLAGFCRPAQKTKDAAC